MIVTMTTSVVKTIETQRWICRTQAFRFKACSFPGTPRCTHAPREPGTCRWFQAVVVLVVMERREKEGGSGDANLGLPTSIALDIVATDFSGLIPCFEVIRYDIIGITGGNEMTNGKA